MSKMTRKDFLKFMGAGAAAFAFGKFLLDSPMLRSPSRQAEAQAQHQPAGGGPGPRRRAAGLGRSVPGGHAFMLQESSAFSVRPSTCSGGRNRAAGPARRSGSCSHRSDQCWRSPQCWCSPCPPLGVSTVSGGSAAAVADHADAQSLPFEPGQRERGGGSGRPHRRGLAGARSDFTTGLSLRPGMDGQEDCRAPDLR